MKNIRFLGFKIDKKGIQELSEKVDVICKAPAPRKTTELKRFFGMANYYARFISKIASPLYQGCDEAWSKIKKELISSDVLVHYDPLI